MIKNVVIQNDSKVPLTSKYIKENKININWAILPLHKPFSNNISLLSQNAPLLMLFLIEQPLYVIRNKFEIYPESKLWFMLDEYLHSKFYNNRLTNKNAFSNFEKEVYNSDKYVEYGKHINHFYSSNKYLKNKTYIIILPYYNGFISNITEKFFTYNFKH